MALQGRRLPHILWVKPNPEDWSEYLEHNPDLHKDFDNIFNDPSDTEAGTNFTRDVYYGTYFKI